MIFEMQYSIVLQICCRKVTEFVKRKPLIKRL